MEKGGEKGIEREAPNRTTFSQASSSGSIEAAPSPFLNPDQTNPMTSSIISNLDLGNERENNERSKEISSQEHKSNSSPLAPQDFLSATVHPLSYDESSKGDLSSFADDSALNALVDVHGNSSDIRHSSPHRPSTRDASFGLDPDVDRQNSIKGQPLRAHLLGSPRKKAGHLRSSSIDSRHARSSSRTSQRNDQSHTTAATGAPTTMETGIDNVEAIPTVSATGVPRFLPRRTSEKSAKSDDLASQASAPAEIQPQYSPSGSLTLALFSSNLSWQRRTSLLFASIAINIGLPFINGVMLGFGEIFARSVIAPWIGLAPAAISINAPAMQSSSRRDGNVNGILNNSTTIESETLKDDKEIRLRR